MSVEVSAADTAAAHATLARLRELLPEPVVEEGTRVGMVFWHVTDRGPHSDHRSIEALEWEEVERNYPRATRERLEDLMRAFVQGEGSRLLLWARRAEDRQDLGGAGARLGVAPSGARCTAWSTPSRSSAGCRRT